MGLMGRFTMIVKAKANKALDSAEDPRETLDYSYEKQLEMLQKVRRGVADVATSKKRLELQAAKLEQSVEKLDGQARMALQQNREDLARVALERKKGVQLQLQSIDQQREQLQAEQDKLVVAEQRLTAKVEAFRTRKETIKAQYTAAEAQTKIGEAVTGVSEEMADVGMAIERAENKTETMRARAGAIDELIESGALTDLTDGRDSIDRELEQLTASSGVDAELEQMKAELGSGGRPPSSSAAARQRRDRPGPRRGQYRLDEEAFAAASEIDDRVQAAADAGDEAGFQAALTSWSTPSACSGTLPADDLEGSDAIVPGHGTTLAEARELLS